MGSPQGRGMVQQPFSLPEFARAGNRLPMMLLGARLALPGVCIVELVLFFGGSPLTPIGWPSLGMIAAAGIAGIPGLVGGTVILVGYYLLNLAQPERFAEFYSGIVPVASWGIAIAFLAGSAAFVRPRLVRLATAEAELV